MDALKLFLAFIFFHFSCFLVLAQEDPISCPKDFQCGNLGQLHYPLTNVSIPECGFCLVKCNPPSSPYPKIQFDKSSDQILDAITMESDSIIKLKDPQFQWLLKNKRCNTFYYQINLPNSSSVSFRISSNMTTLFRCSNYSSSSAHFSKERIDMFHSIGYQNFTTCDGIQIFYRNPQYHHRLTPPSKEFSPPQGCTAIHYPVSPWNDSTAPKEIDPFELLSSEFFLEWQLNKKDKSRIVIVSVAGKKIKSTVIIVTASLGGGVVVVFGIIVAFWSIIRKKLPWWMISCMNELEDQQVENFLKNNVGPKRYHYSDLKKITNSFDTKLGEGGYGSVYKGKLCDGSLVAVKVLKESKGNNGEEFINEVESISRTSHVNIVTLLGFSVQGQKKALIYEFMTNGSLEKFIYQGRSVTDDCCHRRRLEWPILYKIALGIARGLEYLHRGCNTRILHFDIKPQNILLDEDFCPKISDFGLAKLYSKTKDSSILDMDIARGTIGFIAPEIVYKNIGGVSHKSDVYSYGMMVLEMVGGRKNADTNVDRASQQYFPHWIYTKLINQGGRDEEFCLSEIRDEEENKQVRKMLMVSLWCIQTNPSSRPTIGNVLEMLEGPLESIQMPPTPFLYSLSLESSSPSNYLSSTD